nr:MAG TPA: hypothetical protein [Caudoviricetes sp.]
MVGCNCFSCSIGCQHKRAKPTKGHLWPRNYTTPTQLCQGFLTRFFQKIFLHTVPTIPKLYALLRHAMQRKSRAI